MKNKYKNTMKRIKNSTIYSYDKLLKDKKDLENTMANLQREKDLKVDKINNYYEAVIEGIIRTLKVIDNEIEKSKDYVSNN